MGWLPNYQSEDRIYAACIKKNYPNGKIAALSQNDDAATPRRRPLAQVLKPCGDDLTRENVMRQAANPKNFTSDVLLPGIKINTSPTDLFPIEQMQLMRFNGESWELFGEIVSGEVGHQEKEAPQPSRRLPSSAIPECRAPRAARAGRATAASRDSRLRPESPSAGSSARC